ncbi:ABC transporter substrate-binding protein [Bifidobacterium pullorum]|nr:extracellular solute-binding protein [Bifidobacterium pullorum]
MKIRKSIISTVSVLCIAAMVSACGNGGAAGANNAAGGNNDPHANDNAECTNVIKNEDAEKVTLWAWSPGVAEAVDHFNETHDDLQICWTQAGVGGDEYTKFTTANKAGKGAPDVIQLEYEVIGQYVAGSTKYLVDLMDYGAGDVKDLYTDGAWNSISLGSDEHAYGIPIDIGPVAMIYRKDIFDKYGVEIPTTWDEYEQAGKDLKAAGYTGYIGNFSSGGTNFHNVAAFAQNNAVLYDYTSDDPTEIGIDWESDEAKQVLEYWQRLYQEGLIAADDAYTNDWYKNLNDGNYATLIWASWIEGNLLGVDADKVEGAEWRIANPPVWDENSSSMNLGGSSLAVTTQAKHTEAAAKVAMGLYSDDESWNIAIEKGSMYPSAKKVLESDEFLNREDAFYGGQKVNEILAPIASSYKGFNYTPFQSKAYELQQPLLLEAVKEGADVDSTLKEIDTQVTDYAEQQGYTIK